MYSSNSSKSASEYIITNHANRVEFISPDVTEHVSNTSLSNTTDTQPNDTRLQARRTLLMMVNKLVRRTERPPQPGEQQSRIAIKTYLYSLQSRIPTALDQLKAFRSPALAGS